MTMPGVGSSIPKQRTVHGWLTSVILPTSFSNSLRACGCSEDPSSLCFLTATGCRSKRPSNTYPTEPHPIFRPNAICSGSRRKGAFKNHADAMSHPRWECAPGFREYEELVSECMEPLATSYPHDCSYLPDAPCCVTMNHNEPRDDWQAVASA